MVVEFQEFAGGWRQGPLKGFERPFSYRGFKKKFPLVCVSSVHLESPSSHSLWEKHKIKDSCRHSSVTPSHLRHRGLPHSLSGTFCSSQKTLRCSPRVPGSPSTTVLFTPLPHLTLPRPRRFLHLRPLLGSFRSLYASALWYSSHVRKTQTAAANRPPPGWARARLGPAATAMVTQ